jgi:vanillate O-demethylase ferredoxin subunit
MIAVRITKKTVVAEKICSFELVAIDNRSLPPFSAGSHIDVHLPGGLIRQYSLCNGSGGADRYVIGVLRDPQSRGGSIAMHEIEEGEEIVISEPRNHFSLTPRAQHSLLIAGGIGVTPLLCMAEQLADEGASFELHYCARTDRKIAFKDRLKMAHLADHTFLHLDDADESQRFDARATLNRSHGSDVHVYTCGPGPFIDMVLNTARGCGYQENQLHREYFSAEVQSISAEDQSFEIQIASSGKTIFVDAGTTVVSALAAHGINLPVSCEQGVCGTCVTRILEGVPLHRDVYMTDAERAANDQFTPCCSRSRTPVLVLDL